MDLFLLRYTGSNYCCHIRGPNMAGNSSKYRGLERKRNYPALLGHNIEKRKLTFPDSFGSDLYNLMSINYGQINPRKNQCKFIKLL